MGCVAHRDNRPPMPTAAIFQRPSLLQRLAPLFRGFDMPLLLLCSLLAGVGLLAMYSSGFDHGTRFVDHGRNTLIALGILFVVAQLLIHHHGGAVAPWGVALFAGRGSVWHHQKGCAGSIWAW